MKIVVIGGSGLIGSKLVNNLRQRGHEVVAASPASGVNTITGEGLAEALAGAQVVVDVANSPSFEDRAVLVNLQTGRCFELNRIGAEIWQLLAGGKSVGGACDALAERYPAARDVLRDDVLGLIRSLLREKLAEIVAL